MERHGTSVFKTNVDTTATSTPLFKSRGVPEVNRTDSEKRDFRPHSSFSGCGINKLCVSSAETEVAGILLGVFSE